ncbi:MAG: glycosyltransferase family 2 protein [Patescibacteria group bacterium]
MDLSIIIVSWNVREKLKENLLALYDSVGDINFEVFVVDNNSTDNTVEMIKNDFFKVKLIANNQNLGFAKANNQAIKRASGKYVLLINPDMKVFPNTLANMVGWMNNHPQAAVASCQLIDIQNSIIKHIRRFPGLIDQLAIVLKLPHFIPSILKKYLREDFDYSHEAVVDSIRGSFFMIRAKVLDKVGLLDEQYFIWFEEVDYCQRIKAAGLEVWYTPIAQSVDYIGQSFQLIKTLKKQKYFCDSQLKYFKKWRPIWQYWLLKIAWLIGIILSFVAEVANFKSKAKT